MKKDLVSLVVPCYNEESNIRPFYDAVKDVFVSMREKFSDTKPEFEILFVNDGSGDGTLEMIKKLNEEDRRVKGISFARNFGKEAALFAGIRAAHGDCVAFLDADLQHPPASRRNVQEMERGICRR